MGRRVATWAAAGAAWVVALALYVAFYVSLTGPIDWTTLVQSVVIYAPIVAVFVAWTGWLLDPSR